CHPRGRLGVGPQPRRNPGSFAAAERRRMAAGDRRGKIAAVTVAPVATEAAQETEPEGVLRSNEAEMNGAEVSMTGTDGARVLTFPRPVSGADNDSGTVPTSSARTSSEVDQSSSARTSPGANPTSSTRTLTRTFPAKRAGVGFLGISGE